jgi:hypothetical protein
MPDTVTIVGVEAIALGVDVIFAAFTDSVPKLEALNWKSMFWAPVAMAVLPLLELCKIVTTDPTVVNVAVTPAVLVTPEFDTAPAATVTVAVLELFKPEICSVRVPLEMADDTIVQFVPVIFDESATAKVPVTAPAVTGNVTLVSDGACTVPFTGLCPTTGTSGVVVKSQVMAFVLATPSFATNPGSSWMR